MNNIPESSPEQTDRKQLIDKLRKRLAQKPSANGKHQRDDSDEGDGYGDAFEHLADRLNGGHHTVSDAAFVWPDPQPLPAELPPVAPFDYRLLPDAFAPYVSDIAERMQCPPDFPAVAIMTAYSSVVGKQIGIRPKRHDDWLVIPNLWGMVVGRPGVMKTPAIRE